MGNEIVYINLDDIIPNRFQPREVFDEKALNELADSIRQHGVIEPIIVRPISNKYEIVAGERRYKASAIAGLTKIPCLIRDMDDKESSLVAYIENEQRKDVSVIEKARTASRILKANNMTQDELATSLGISQSTLANRLRLLDLPLEVQESLMRNEISERHARSLLSVKDVEKQIALLNEIKDKKMTVRELESEIKMMNRNIEQDITNNFDSTLNNSMPNNFINPTFPQENMGFNNVPKYDVPVTNNPQEIVPSFNPVADTVMNNPQEATPTFNATIDPAINSSQEIMPTFNPVTEPSNIPSTPMFNSDFSLPPIDSPQEPVVPTSSNDTMEYLNNNSTMEYLNNTDDNPSDDGNTGGSTNFMEYLNNYDKKEETPAEPSNNFYNNEPANTGFNNFLNNYQSPSVDTNSAVASNNFNDTNSGLLINNTTPPITSNFNTNSYVEDNPNYVDVSKKEEISSVDEIIEELKTTINGIKAKSKLKIDTDEINFDDLYQITIKIDKRDF